MSVSRVHAVNLQNRAPSCEPYVSSAGFVGTNRVAPTVWMISEAVPKVRLSGAWAFAGAATGPLIIPTAISRLSTVCRSWVISVPFLMTDHARHATPDARKLGTAPRPYPGVGRDARRARRRSR